MRISEEWCLGSYYYSQVYKATCEKHHNLTHACFEWWHQLTPIKWHRGSVGGIAHAQIRTCLKELFTCK